MWKYCGGFVVCTDADKLSTAAYACIGVGQPEFQQQGIAARVCRGGRAQRAHTRAAQTAASVVGNLLCACAQAYNPA